jgi:hypothetical protein
VHLLFECNGKEILSTNTFVPSGKNELVGYSGSKMIRFAIKNICGTDDYCLLIRYSDKAKEVKPDAGR